MSSHEFLPIKYELMDGFWCSSCLNNSINLPDMIGSLASSANTSFMAKNETKKTFQTLRFSIAILRYLEAEFNRGYFIIFCLMVLRFYTKNFKSFQAKIKPWRWFSGFKIKSKFRKIAVLPSFLYAMTWYFLCRMLEP